MLDIQRFVCNMFQENCYVVSDETKECVIIDCGTFFEEEKIAIYNYINDNNLTPKHLLCTHGHVDHNFGNKFILDKFGLLPEISEADKPLMNNLGKQAKAFTGEDCGNDFPEIGRFYENDKTITFGNHEFAIIPTPGHSPGSVFIYCKDESVAFSGDTLFKLSIGRTDLQLGNYEDIIESLHSIAKVLPADTTVLPGHGEHTTIGYEVKFNPYLKKGSLR